MHKTTSSKMQSRARSATRVSVSDRDRKINAKIAKQNVAHKQRLAAVIADYHRKYPAKS